MISMIQVKAARLLLGWEQKDLARESGVSLPTIQRMEKLGLERSSVYNAEKVKSALERGGVQFIFQGLYTGDGGDGVRLIDKEEDKSK